MSRIDLVWLGDAASVPRWKEGSIHRVGREPEAVRHWMEDPGSDAAGCLFWDSTLGPPDPQRVQRAMELPGDCWHAGLRLGTSGLPGIIDFVNPTWTLNRDPDAAIESTSWRVSLRACLVRGEVLREMGPLLPGFRTLEAAALELGHRWVTRGVLPRQVPWLIDEDVLPAPSMQLPFEDELRFALHRFGPFWARWALARATMCGYAGFSTAMSAWAALRGTRPEPSPRTFAVGAVEPAEIAADPRVSVLVPTVDRYPYLRTLLRQLERQTVPPCQVIVVDQTPADRREDWLLGERFDLPLRVIRRDTPGQCTSRNAGLEAAEGEYVLFLDDDDEVEDTLIEEHLRALSAQRADVSSGVADELGAGPLPESFSFRRASDVFPTNNTMIRRDVLRASGLFDLAYDRASRADGDLGTRIYLTGAVMVLTPSISVLHHHAPSGGLRTHRARVVTYASSRQRILQRHLPSVSEIYLGMRYFTPRQVRESLWIRALGTCAVRGGTARRLLKAAAATLMMPSTVREIRRRRQAAERMLREYPRIPVLPTTVPSR